VLKLEISYRVTISSRILVSFRGCFFLGWLWKPSFLLLLIKTTIGKDGLDSIESMDDGLIIIIIIIIIYLFIYIFIYSLLTIKNNCAAKSLLISCVGMFCTGQTKEPVSLQTNRILNLNLDGRL
jgi:hypothetical protein